MSSLFRRAPFWVLWIVLSALYLFIVLAALAPRQTGTAVGAAGPAEPASTASPPQPLGARLDETPAPTPTVGVAQSRFFLLRPIPPGHTLTISRFYPYGATAGGRYETHHGVEFENPTGTPVVAAGPGKIVYARDDAVRALGPTTTFYGLAVVIEHPQRFRGQKLYTLYAHLDAIAVREGQAVETGDLLGTVGMSGIALGSHLHFEVRAGENTYDHTRNPELWLQPFRRYGTLAGRIELADGSWPREAWVGLYRPGDLGGGAFRSVLTYADDSVNPDDELGENFVLGDVPAGEYEVRFRWDGLTYSQPVHLEGGAIASLRLGP